MKIFINVLTVGLVFAVMFFVKTYIENNTEEYILIILTLIAATIVAIFITE